MTREQVWRPLIPVDSTVRQSAARIPLKSEANSTCWGKPSRFQHGDAPGMPEGAGSPQEDRRSRVTIRWPEEHVDVIRTRTWRPVWSQWNVFLVRNPDDPGQFFHTMECRAFLILLSDEPYNKIVGYSSKGEVIREQLTIRTYLRFDLPPSDMAGTYQETITQGQWPQEPEELIPGG